jgi:two-component system sensor histidine kinase/response regulator
MIPFSSNPEMRPRRFIEEPANRTHIDGGIRRVHIIDDDAALGAALSAGLEAYGYRTTFSCTAEAGWTAMHQELPDLVLCDINMPGRNGHRLLEDVRKDDELGNCPFVFMTGNPIFASPRDGMDLGADDFLLKPFTLETLVACVGARLRRSEISSQGEARLVKELRDGLRRSLPHEFFTPLTGVMGFAEMLDQDGDFMNPAERKEALKNIMLSGRRLQRTLRNYIYALDRLAPDSATPFSVLSGPSIKQVLEQGVKAAADRHQRQADILMEIEGTPIAGSAYELAILVEELMDNALSFSPVKSVVRVRALRVADEYLISVADHGRGMTRQQLKSLGLFRQFDRHKYEQQGLGVGLFIVQQVVRRFGGRLRFESVQGSGTTCHVILPVAPEADAR